VEWEEQDINRRIWQENNSLLYIVHHLKNNRIDQLEKFYELSRTQKEFSPQSYFANILALIRYGYQPDACKALLSQLLAIENYRIDLLSMLPLEVFKDIKRYNPVTYERKLKKITSKEEVPRLQCISDCSRGYSEVMLAIVTYMQNGIVKRLQQDVWSRILDIIGRHDLDFHRVIDIMLEKIVGFL
jgi:hypothetical protein